MRPNDAKEFRGKMMDELIQQFADSMGIMYQDAVNMIIAVIGSLLVVFIAVQIIDIVLRIVEYVTDLKSIQADNASSGVSYNEYEMTHGWDDYEDDGGFDWEYYDTLSEEDQLWYSSFDSDDDYWAQYDEWDLYDEWDRNTGLIERDEWMK